jgi:hypothetical protein
LPFSARSVPVVLLHNLHACLCVDGIILLPEVVLEDRKMIFRFRFQAGPLLYSLLRSRAALLNAWRTDCAVDVCLAWRIFFSVSPQFRKILDHVPFSVDLLLFPVAAGSWARVDVAERDQSR